MRKGIGECSDDHRKVGQFGKWAVPSGHRKVGHVGKWAVRNAQCAKDIQEWALGKAVAEAEAGDFLVESEEIASLDTAASTERGTAPFGGSEG